MSVFESEERKAVVDEAMSWCGTKYHSSADIKGSGVDCGMLLVRVFVDVGQTISDPVGHFPPPFDPRPYPAQWHLHNRAERYMGIVAHWAKELDENAAPQPGDIALFHYGQCYAHGGIITEWPIVVHAMGPNPVVPVNVEHNTLMRNLRRKFFTIWY